MSTQKGNTERRNRPQKYKNRTAFRNDLHDSTPQIKFINSIQVAEVCQHCKSVIEWKIKYKKYKPLSQAKTCIKCSNRTVKKAYHVICSSCARASRCCAKCLKAQSETIQIEPPAPSLAEQIKLKQEMDQLIKSLSERKRRTFLRFMKKGKETEKKQEILTEAESEDTTKIIEKQFIPHTKEELIEKIRLIRLNNDEDDDDEFCSDLDLEEDDSESSLEEESQKEEDEK